MNKIELIISSKLKNLSIHKKLYLKYNFRTKYKINLKFQTIFKIFQMQKYN